MTVSSLLDRLARRTTSGRFIAEIDGLRFVSIALVVLFHVAGFVAANSGALPAEPPRGALAGFAAMGHYGVQLFFVISGFVLALPFASHRLGAGPPVRLRAYFLRRVTRLEPPYIIAMTVFLALWIGLNGANAAPTLRHYWAGIVYLHNIIFQQPNTLNVVAWSLEIEVQFYVLAPLLGLAFGIGRRSTRRLVIAGAAAAAVTLQAALVPADSVLRLTLLNYVQYFLIGFLLADIYLVDWRGTPERDGRWDAVAVSAWAAIIAVWLWGRAVSLLFPALAFVAFCGAFRGRLASRVLSNRWVTTIGGMCYTIYLLHYPFISFVGRYTLPSAAGRSPTLHLVVQLALIVPLLLVVSAVYFALIERPCMERDWPRRLGRRLRGARAREALPYNMDQAAP